MKTTVAITMGDPAGIGPEVVLKAVTSSKVKRLCRLAVLGDEMVLRYLARKMGIGWPAADIRIINLSSLNPEEIRPGRPDSACGRAMMRYVEEAVLMAMDGDVDAMVTGPINKEAINRAGYKFPGHTEFMADLTRTRDYAMMLGGKKLKVVLVTIHESIKRVPGLLTIDNIYKTIQLTDGTFKKYFGLKPRIAVAALNPHGGEKGLFGNEEKKVIVPAIKRARRAGIEVSDPLPPDTVFYRTIENKEYDVVVCMYHDQGLIPLKLIHFEDGVNVTLGLPIIRTSVAHGTAYDIAWKGVASPKSMIAAIEMAVSMAKKI
ncbi:MAG: 4-hydroxythreonine-4-phosphate dehydrogenase PdxA [Thermodesulfobacteriota bacterium]